MEHGTLLVNPSYHTTHTTKAERSADFFLFLLKQNCPPPESISGVSVLLYVGYMLIASYSFFMLTGAIGFLACFLFVRAIYAAVKVE